jgi:hypothetical protein
MRLCARALDRLDDVLSRQANRIVLLLAAGFLLLRWGL